MKKASLIAILGISTILAGGCSNLPFIGGGEPEAVAPASPEQSASPQAKPKEETSPKDGEAKAQKPKSIPTTSLVQSTSSTERVRQVQKGRTDPFDNISIEPIVKVSPIPGRENSPVPRVDSLPRVNRPRGTNIPNKIKITPPKTTPKTTPKGKTNSGSSSNPTNRTTTPPPKPTITVREPSRVNPSPLPLPELPPPPQPTVARAIEVTGVVQAGGVPQAIVKEPNSDFQRYVKAGDYLANGQVLVKRIEMKSGPQPVVVLEQLGVEVSRRVGDKPITAQGDSTNSSG